MSFFDSVKLPQSNTEGTTGSGGFFDSVKMPSDPERAVYLSELKRESSRLKSEADKANSFTGLLGGTFKEVPRTLSKIGSPIIDFMSGRGKKPFSMRPELPSSDTEYQSALQNISDRNRSSLSDVISGKGSGTLTQGYGWGERTPILSPVVKAGKKAYEAVDSTLYDFGDRMVNLMDSLDSEKNKDPGIVTERLSRALSAGIGVANIGFLPASATLSGAEEMPVVGPLAKGINYIFGKAGELGEWEADAIVDALPVSDRTKESIIGPARELAGLLNMVALGKVGHSTAKDLKGRYTEKLDLIEEKRNNGIELTKTEKALVKSEKVISNAEKVTGKVIVTVNDAKNRILELKDQLRKEIPKGYEELKSENLQQKEPVSQPEPATKSTFIESVKTPELSPEVKTGPTAQSKTGVDIKTEAFERGIKEDFGEIADYKVMNMKEQSRMAEQLINTNAELAKKVAVGDAIPPEGLKAGSVFTALKNRAIASGDIETLRTLAKSNLASRLGQEIKAFDDSGVTADPVKAMKAVEEGRRSNFRSARVKQEKLKLQNEIAKATPKLKDWDSFIRSIQC